ncbi:MAG TPA: cupredoxin family copper-binding protein [Candidatus Limnocylindria bacterium]|nr:cupredoxin family copper-binding protein [Candidatus Limnocylindria bacterium]
MRAAPLLLLPLVGLARLSLAVVACASLAVLAGCGGGSRPTHHVVVIRGFQFDPAALTVAIGDTIEWRNRDIFPHTSTADDGAWDSGNLPADTAWSTVIARPGAHAYHCSYHPNMKAQLDAR